MFQRHFLRRHTLDISRRDQHAADQQLLELSRLVQFDFAPHCVYCIGVVRAGAVDVSEHALVELAGLAEDVAVHVVRLVAANDVKRAGLLQKGTRRRR